MTPQSKGCAPVPAEISSRMFEPYVSGRNGKDNMGLGLAIVRKIVVEHGGEIRYEERERRPTVRDHAAEAQRMSESDAAKPCALIVDDEKNIRAAVQLALAPEGMHVIAAHDAPAALRALREHVIDLVILDIRLGGVDGLTLFRRIQADAPIPVIFISGQASLTQAAQAVRIGAFDLSRSRSARKSSPLSCGAVSNTCRCRSVCSESSRSLR